jgi:formate dehydrogenase maturation protein FdhE
MTNNVLRMKVWRKPQYCPICGSVELSLEIVYDEDVNGNICQVWVQVKCNKCNWFGRIIEEKQDDNK